MNKAIIQRKKQRISSRVVGDAKIPRLAVYRSSKHIYAQLIDDGKQVTLVSSSDNEVKDIKTKTKKAFETGRLIADKAKSLKIEKVRFDRGGFRYHGRIQALADGARANGLSF